MEYLSRPMLLMKQQVIVKSNRPCHSSDNACRLPACATVLTVLIVLVGGSRPAYSRLYNVILAEMSACSEEEQR